MRAILICMFCLFALSCDRQEVYFYESTTIFSTGPETKTEKFRASSHIDALVKGYQNYIITVDAILQVDGKYGTTVKPGGYRVLDSKGNVVRGMIPQELEDSIERPFQYLINIDEIREYLH